MGHVFFADLTDGLPAGLHTSNGGLDFPPAQVVELSKVQHNANAAHRKHEHQEDRLLGGPRYIALHLLQARITVTLKDAGNAEAVQKVLACQETYLKCVAEYNLDYVEARDALLLTYLGVLAVEETSWCVWDLLHFQAVGFVLSAAIVGVLHQDTIDVAQFAGSFTAVLRGWVEEGVAAVPLFGRLVH